MSFFNAISAIATLVSAAAAGASIIKGFTEKKPKAIKPPILSAPAVMPTKDDDAIRAAKLEAIRKRSKASGRQSTILSEPLGGS